jgi:chromosome segregation ATPase
MTFWPKKDKEKEGMRIELSTYKKQLTKIDSENNRLRERLNLPQEKLRQTQLRERNTEQIISQYRQQPQPKPQISTSNTQTKYCKTCGENIPILAGFCGYCSHKQF